MVTGRDFVWQVTSLIFAHSKRLDALPNGPRSVYLPRVDIKFVDRSIGTWFGVDDWQKYISRHDEYYIECFLSLFRRLRRIRSVNISLPIAVEDDFIIRGYIWEAVRSMTPPDKFGTRLRQTHGLNSATITTTTLFRWMKATNSCNLRVHVYTVTFKGIRAGF